MPFEAAVSVRLPVPSPASVNDDCSAAPASELLIVRCGAPGVHDSSGSLALTATAVTATSPSEAAYEGWFHAGARFVFVTVIVKVSQSRAVPSQTEIVAE